MTKLAKIYALLLVAVMIWLVGQFVNHSPIQTQLTALLPQSAQSEVIQTVEKYQENQLNQQIIILIGADDSERAFQAAEQRLILWQNNGLFAKVDGKINPDLSQLRQSLHTLGAATLPAEQIQQLYENPKQYFIERAEVAANPFSGSLLSLTDDWLGFSRFVLQKQANQVHWHSEHAMLYAEFNGKTWVWLRAKLNNHQPNPMLLNWWQQEKKIAQSNHYEFVASGGALFAADAKQSAERESSVMSGVGLTLTFALLLAVFRSWRVLWLALPLGVGVLMGLAAAVAVFGEIHALTLVVGTSLVGVLVDFPLHWLAPSLFRQPENGWQGTESMRYVLPSFLISLTITVVGYILLYFTPLPVLRQTAVFSAAALLGAFGATVCFLPVLMKKYVPRKMRLPNIKISPKFNYFMGILAILLCFGITKTHWQDDIRQWANLRADLLADTQLAAQISQMNATQTVILIGKKPDDLLQKSRELENRLRNVANIQTLNQWILPINEQVALKKQFANLAKQPENFAPLVALGVPSETIQAALNAAANAPTVTLSDSLNAPQAEAFRGLYVGEIAGQSVGLARIGSLKTGTNVADYLPENAFLLDKRSELNQQFTHTRNLAAWLKMGSLLVAWWVLMAIFGWRRGSVILLLPMLALMATIGVLGWLNLTIGLFVMFGLLLTLAIGVDYAVYAFHAPETAAARLMGVGLAAITTGISFGLLALSATPAVMAFGVSVALGVVFNWAAISLAIYFRLPEMFFYRK